MKYSKHLLLTCIFMLVFFIDAQAQANFKPGYIISLSGDTIHGSINYKSEKEMGEVCTFKQSDGVITKYSPTEIDGYRFINGKYYISKEHEGQVYFFEFLIEGQIKVYYLSTHFDEHRYYIEKDGSKLIEIPYKEEIREKIEKDKSYNYYYRSTQHIGILYHYMSDAPELKRDIERIGKPNHRSLIDIAKKYHNAVCDDDVCVVYEKKMPFTDINFEIVGGMIFFKDNIYIRDARDGVLNKKNYFHGGVIVHMGMPRNNENLFVRTGFLYSRTNTALDKNINSYKIPIQLEYIYPKEMLIRPKLAVGGNIYLPFETTISLMAGINVKITKSIYWSINYEIDFDTPSLFKINKLYTQSLTSGIYFVIN